MASTRSRSPANSPAEEWGRRRGRERVGGGNNLKSTVHPRESPARDPSCKMFTDNRPIMKGEKRISFDSRYPFSTGQLWIGSVSRVLSLSLWFSIDEKKEENIIWFDIFLFLKVFYISVIKNLWSWFKLIYFPIRGKNRCCSFGFVMFSVCMYVCMYVWKLFNKVIFVMKNRYFFSNLFEQLNINSIINRINRADTRRMVNLNFNTTRFSIRLRIWQVRGEIGRILSAGGKEESLMRPPRCMVHVYAHVQKP